MMTIMPLYFREKVKCVCKYLFDGSLPFVLFVVGLTALMSASLMMLLTSCGTNTDKQNELRMMAVENLRLTVDDQKSLHIMAFSEIDSVFGRNFFNNDEVMLILKNVEEFNSINLNDSLLSKVIDVPGFDLKIKRGIDLSNTFQKIIELDSERSDEFSGWKMKVLYEYENDYKDTVRNEKYFIFDKTMNHIIHTFEIPIL